MSSTLHELLWKLLSRDSLDRAVRRPTKQFRVHTRALEIPAGVLGKLVSAEERPWSAVRTCKVAYVLKLLFHRL